MWIVIGIILIVYAVVVLVILYHWWKAVLEFVREILSDAGDAIQTAEEMIPPIQDTAASARQVSGSIRGVGSEIARVVPPALAAVAAATQDLDTSVTAFRNDANRQLDDVATQAKQTLDELAQMLSEQGTITFPSVTALLRAVAAQFDELEYRLTAAVVTDLNTNHGVPPSITDLLADLLDRHFPDRATFDLEVKARLSEADYNAHHETINDASLNPDVENDLAAIIEAVAETVKQVGEQTLPETADSLDDLADAYVALVTVLLGPAAPLAILAIAVANGLLLLKNVISAINIKVNKGDWLDAHVFLPPVDISVGLTTVPAGLISFSKHWNVGGRRIGFSFDLPDNDHNAQLDIARRGQWYDHRWHVPPSDVELFSGRGLVDAIEDVRARAEAIRDTVLNANQTAGKLRASADKMRESGDRLVLLGVEKLPKQAAKMKDLAMTVRGTADKLDQVGARIAQRAQAVAQQASDLLDKIRQFRDRLLTMLNEASQSIARVTRAVTDIDLGPTVTHLYNGADGLRDAANRIDDGTPVGTPGKLDLAQKFYNVLEAVRKILPSTQAAESVIKPIFCILAALHVGVLVAGIWLVVRSI